MVIDETLVQNFCNQNNLKKENVFHGINLWDVNKDSPIEQIIGFIGVQLYAVWDIENELALLFKIIFNKNYNNSLCYILNIDVKEWQKWAKDHQKNIWQKFYNWCSSKGFIIERCPEGNSYGKYVKYPLYHGKRMFHSEELNKLAGLFVERGLRPGEDISENEFFDIIWPDDYFQEFDSSKRIYYTSRMLNLLIRDLEHGKRQIFLFYLRWEGKYKRNKKIFKFPKNTNKLILFRENGKCVLRVYNIKSKSFVKTLPFDYSFNTDELRPYFIEKHQSLILFKKLKNEDNCWEETRFISDKNEEGIAIILYKNDIEFDRSDVLSSKIRRIIIRVHFDSPYYKEFYAEERSYRFVGGHEIMTNAYLKNSLPFIETTNPLKFFIDGELHHIKENGRFILNLREGTHILKFKNRRQITLKVLPDTYKGLKTSMQ